MKIKRGCDKNDKSDGNSIKMTNPLAHKTRSRYLIIYTNLKK